MIRTVLGDAPSMTTSAGAADSFTQKSVSPAWAAATRPAGAASQRRTASPLRVNRLKGAHAW
jgi:hypothetical protein